MMEEPLEEHKLNNNQSKSRILRILSIPILVLLAMEIASGSLLADQRVAGIPYDFGFLVFHALAKILLLAVTVLAVIISGRLPSLGNRVAAAVAFGSTLGATIAGLAYQYAGKSPIADGVMGGLSGLVLIAAILLLIWGSVAKTKHQ
jgi:hypothetical protein